MIQSRTTDSKGRVTLGERFANRTVIVEEVDDTEVRVTMARVIPEREAWLYENPKALEAVRRGLNQASVRRFVAPPNMRKAHRIADRTLDKDG